MDYGVGKEREDKEIVADDEGGMAEQQGDGWHEYTGRDEEVVAMVFSGDNFWRNFRLEDGGFDELVEASWRRLAQLAVSGSDDPQRAPGRGLAASAARGREGPGASAGWWTV